MHRSVVKVLLFAIVLLGYILPMPAAHAACRTAESEPNDSDAGANAGVCAGTPVTGSIANGSDYDWYRLNVVSAGTIGISLSHNPGADLDWFLYAATGGYIAHASTTQNPETGAKYVAGAGDYYIRVKRYSGSGSYTLTVTGPIEDGNGGGGSSPCALPGGVNLGKVGSTTDRVATTSGGFVLMGGGTDVDAAIQWMIGKAGGGDVVVLRSTGTNAYNSYIQGLGTVNSVQTLLVNSAAEGDDACVGETIRRAEMLFIAGGNQQDYVDFFKGRAVGDAINYLVNTKRAPVGGTSAGMAILGEYYHPGGAPDNTTVLQNPTGTAIGSEFVSSTTLDNIVTDTHFSQRSRQPRLMAFMASAIHNLGATWQSVRGIGCDEATAYAVDVNGAGKVFGANYCFFAKATGAPEVLRPGSPLTWNVAQSALNVYRVRGTATGANTFNLGTFTGTGGTTQYWYASNGTFASR